jgi:hypothetical protein
MDEKLQKLLEASKILPDKYNNTVFDNGIIKKETAAMIYEPGEVVAIRAVDKKYKNETFIGILVGQWYGNGADQCKNVIERMLLSRGNPIIYVFKIKTFLRGFESWWGSIPISDLEGKTCSDLLGKYKITQDTINDAAASYLITAFEIEAERFSKLCKENEVNDT